MHLNRGLYVPFIEDGDDKDGNPQQNKIKKIKIKIKNKNQKSNLHVNSVLRVLN